VPEAFQHGFVPQVPPGGTSISMSGCGRAELS